MEAAANSNISLRQRLRTRAGCITCKRRRKKCGEEKPICGACRRLFLPCSWSPDAKPQGTSSTNIELYDPQFSDPRFRQRSTVPKSIDLSAFRGQVCAAHVLETCFKATNFSFDPVYTERNGVTIQATLSFAPTDTSMAWSCIVALGLLFVGSRYHDQSLVGAAELQHVGIVNRVRMAVEKKDEGVNYDMLAAINLLGVLNVIRSRIGTSSRADEWLLHGIGLSAAMETMQPEQFQTAHALALFEYMRFGIVVTALLTGRPTCLVSKAWTTIPWARAEHNKGSMQRLIDLMCESSPLQPLKHLTSLVPDCEGDPAASQIPETVERLLIQLYDWRRSVEFSLSTRLRTVNPPDKPSMLYANDVYSIQFERPDDLFELALFNMVLIYLCRFLKGAVPLQRCPNDPAITSIKGAETTQTSLLPTTPLSLPIGDPVARAKIAAREIYVISKCLTSDGLFGFGTLYLSVPLLVAKDFLLREGDAEGHKVDEAFNHMFTIWTGRV